MEAYPNIETPYPNVESPIMFTTITNAVACMFRRSQPQASPRLFAVIDENGRQWFRGSRSECGTFKTKYDGGPQNADSSRFTIEPVDGRTVAVEFMDSYEGEEPGTILCVFGEHENRRELTIDHGSAIAMIGELSSWVARNATDEQKVTLSQWLQEAQDDENLAAFQYPH